jgi:hypothetical protein
MHTTVRKMRLLRRLIHNLGLRRIAANESGVQLAELAIVLPLLVLLFAATAEFGRYFYQYTTLAKASRIGVRYLATAGVNSLADENAKKLVVYGNIEGSGSPILPRLTIDNVSITRRNSEGAIQNAGVPETVTVQITEFQHEPLFDLGGLMKDNALSLRIDVKPSVTMRYLLNTPLV